MCPRAMVTRTSGVPMARSVTQFQGVGDPGTTRTPNILIRSQVLYPVELRDRDSSDSGSKNGSQHASTFLTSCLYVFIPRQSRDLEDGCSNPAEPRAERLRFKRSVAVGQDESAEHSPTKSPLRHFATTNLGAILPQVDVPDDRARVDHAGQPFVGAVLLHQADTHGCRDEASRRIDLMDILHFSAYPLHAGKGYRFIHLQRVCISAAIVASVRASIATLNTPAAANHARRHRVSDQRRCGRRRIR